MCFPKKQMSSSFNVVNLSFLLDCFTPLTLIFYLPKIPTLTTTFRRISYLTPWSIAVPPISNIRPKTHAKVDEIHILSTQQKCFRLFVSFLDQPRRLWRKTKNQRSRHWLLLHTKRSSLSLLLLPGNIFIK